jgi:peptidoglycan/LPS O-acetylase OafA/YrhL
LRAGPGTCLVGGLLAVPATPPGARRILVGVTKDSPATRRVSPLLAGAVVLGLAVGAGAFVLLDPFLAAFVAIVVAVGLAMVVAASDWDRHETFEERELARARRRAEKWDRNADARARDRARWEAHQARKARTGQDGPT